MRGHEDKKSHLPYGEIEVCAVMHYEVVYRYAREREDISN